MSRTGLAEFTLVQRNALKSLYQIVLVKTYILGWRKRDVKLLPGIVQVFSRFGKEQGLKCSLRTGPSGRV